MMDAADFPPNLVDGRHPEDWKVVTKPIKSEYIVNHNDRKVRLLLRILFQVADGFLPVSLIVDTGAMDCLYLSEKAMGAMEKKKLIQQGSKFGDIIIRYGPQNEYKMKAAAQQTPPDSMNLRT
jgi:hypothetical protein